MTLNGRILICFFLTWKLFLKTLLCQFCYVCHYSGRQLVSWNFCDKLEDISSAMTYDHLLWYAAQSQLCGDLRSPVVDCGPATTLWWPAINCCCLQSSQSSAVTCSHVLWFAAQSQLCWPVVTCCCLQCHVPGLQLKICYTCLDYFHTYSYFFFHTYPKNWLQDSNLPCISRLCIHVFYKPKTNKKKDLHDSKISYIFNNKVKYEFKIWYQRSTTHFTL